MMIRRHQQQARREHTHQQSHICVCSEDEEFSHCACATHRQAHRQQAQISSRTIRTHHAHIDEVSEHTFVSALKTRKELSVCVRVRTSAASSSIVSSSIVSCRSNIIDSIIIISSIIIIIITSLSHHHHQQQQSQTNRNPDGWDDRDWCRLVFFDDLHRNKGHVGDGVDVAKGDSGRNLVWDGPQRSTHH